VGAQDQFTLFKTLAERARVAFVQLLEQLGYEIRHDGYEAHVAWVADLCHMANVSPSPLLGVQYLLLAECPGATRIKLVAIPSGEHAAGRVQDLRKRFGQNLTIHRQQYLLHDVFTSSVAMIDGILEEGTTAPVHEVLATLARLPAATHAEPKAGTSDPVTAAHPSGSQAGNRPRRPDWVNQAELVGPCGHTEFANLMNISERHLSRLMQAGTIWREPGPSPNRFYFHHSDHAKHQKLREAFERSRTKRR
jgi:hypothetical protein